MTTTREQLDAVGQEIVSLGQSLYDIAKGNAEVDCKVFDKAVGLWNQLGDLLSEADASDVDDIGPYLCSIKRACEKAASDCQAEGRYNASFQFSLLLSEVETALDKATARIDQLAQAGDEVALAVVNSAHEFNLEHMIQMLQEMSERPDDSEMN